MLILEGAVNYSPTRIAQLQPNHDYLKSDVLGLDVFKTLFNSQLLGRVLLLRLLLVAC